MSEEHQFLLQRVQPAMVGLIDGSLSTLAPIFGVALASHNTRFAFVAGLATALGAAVSMGFSEGLSDTGELTGDRKSTRLNSSHSQISYAVFCLKKKKTTTITTPPATWTA